MKAIKLFFIAVLMCNLGIAQESSRQDTAVYEYYVDDGSIEEEKPVKEKEVKKKNTSSIMDKIYFGGGFGAWFSENYSYLELSPAAGYMITPKFSAGIGLHYQFTSRRYYYINGDSFKRNSSAFGGRIFARQQVYGPIFVYGEYESISFEFPTGVADQFNREWVPGLFLGGGFMQPVGRKGGIGIMFLYNFQYDEIRSPYNSAWVYRFNIFI